tara:strand:- start:14327 stop:16123 length:1797 start_codon:yes stop_codon:yes gene_type:complete
MADKKTKPVKYSSKEFDTIKDSLVNYAKTYYPDTFKDFNASSFGSLMLDTVAYVGDMLSFYIDYQTNESFVDSAIETKNLLKIAKQFGYKNPMAFSANGKAAFYVQVPANTNKTPNTDLIPILKEGTTLSSNNGTSLILTSDVDFNKSDAEVVVAQTDANGDPTSFAFKAYGDVISGFINTEILTVGEYQKFLKISLSDENITEIISIVDSEGNEYFEVPYLSHNVTLQPIRNPNKDGEDDAPYVLREKLASRRFITEVEEDGTVSIQFGFGSENSLKSDEYPDPSSVALQRYARDYYSDDSFDPSVLLKNDKFGVVPPSGDLVVTYRKNDQSTVNIPVNSVNTIVDAILSFPNSSAVSNENLVFAQNSLDVENEEPILGSTNSLVSDEIRVRALNAYSSQNRAVTQQDYVSLVYRMPAKFGSVKRTNIVQDKDSFKRNLNLFVLSQGLDGNLTTTPSTTKENLKVWLSQYKMINDTIDILDGQVVNFSIEYKVLGALDYNQTEVLEQCNNALKSFYAVQSLFGAPFYISEIYRILNDLDSVIDTQDVRIKQKFGTNYSGFSFDIDGATTDDGRFIIVPENVVMELKFPDENIIGVVV